MAWLELGSETLTSDTINGITIDHSAVKFNQAIIYSTQDRNTKPPTITVSGDSTSIAYRKSDNGGAEGTDVNVDEFRLADGTGNNAGFSINHVFNISGEEKLGISSYVNANAVGAGNPPARSVRVWKDDTSAQFTTMRFRMTDGASLTYAGTNFTLLGTD